jgi:uncharacterized DUF497 family protein
MRVLSSREGLPVSSGDMSQFNSALTSGSSAAGFLWHQRRAMNPISPDEARAYLDRWRQVAEAQSQLMRAESMEIKLRQLSTLMASRELVQQRHRTSGARGAGSRAMAANLSLYDEERWLTLGQDVNGLLLVVSHTFEELNELEARVRIISARKASANERTQYESGRSAIGEPMKDEYDFSNATRGKFFRKDAVPDLPVYLEPPVRDYLTARAKARGVDVNELVNDLLKHNIALIEAGK